MLENILCLGHLPMLESKVGDLHSGDEAKVSSGVHLQ
jgi:hypothetical protein